jgi:uncharacterized protein with PIN domain/sulfur carrier protein ThiS
MNTAHFCFFSELNDFLSPARRNTTFAYSFEEHQTVKHLIEAFGVPHIEVARILANGNPVDFDYRARSGDRIDIYPVAAPDGSPPDPHFVLDNHLGQLATYLRIMGFDTLYRNDYQDPELARIAVQEGRVLLTRDRRLLMRKVIVYGYCLRNLDPKLQLVEVLRRFGLFGKIRPFNRCLLCNSLLQPIRKEAILDRLEPLTKLYYDEFRFCASCDQVYWKGSHYERMRRLIEEIALNNEGKI